MATSDKENMFLQSDILKMGWTRTMIKRLLPAPVERRNRQYPHSAPYKLYEKAVVLATMETDAFKEAMAKVEKRRRAEQLRIEAENAERQARQEKLKADIIDAVKPMSITVLPEKEWIKDAIIEWKVSERIALGQYRDNEVIRVNPKNVKREEIPKIAVWYISTHFVEGSVEDYGLYCGFPLFSVEILKKIAEAYPQYADECKRQIVEMETIFG